jgi:hypothetical protein
MAVTSKDGNIVIQIPDINDMPVGISPRPIYAKPMLSTVPVTPSGDITYVKQAPKDTIVFDDSAVSAEALLELYFEDIGGLELATLSRADMIDGQQVNYSPIKNLASFRRRFSPNNMIASFSSLNTYFSKFGIDLLARGTHDPYIDPLTGSVVIEIDTILLNEEIEVEIISNGTIEKVAE